MMRRCKWLAVTSMLVVMSLVQPWSSGAAVAGADPRPFRAVAAHSDLRAQLAEAQAELEQLRRENQQLRREVTVLRDAEAARARKLADQLGSTLIESLH